jgi:hypothetical protein
MVVNQGLTGVTLEIHSSSTVAFSFLKINLTYLKLRISNLFPSITPDVKKRM